MSKTGPLPVESLRTSVRVLEALRAQNGATVTEVAAHLDVAKSTVHDHLTTLHALEFVAKRGAEYRVGMRILELGDAERQDTTLYRLARPELRKLAATTGDHANLMVEEHGFGVYLDVVEGDDAAQLDTHAGFRTHLHTTAMGNAILAHLPDERVHAIVDERGLPAHTDHTVTEQEELFERRARIRERGYAVDTEERSRGIRCVAAAITDEDDATLGAVSVSGLASEMRGERFEEEIPELVVRTANKIEVDLNFA